MGTAGSNAISPRFARARTFHRPRSDARALRPDLRAPARRLGRQRHQDRVPPDPAAGDPLGGPREVSDFQNLHRNKRSITLNLKVAGRPRGVQAHGEEGRRGGREFPARREAPARHRLQAACARSIRASIYAQHFRLRPDGPLCRPAGLRPDRAGHGRADVDHRLAGAGAGARRHSDRRSLRRPVLRARHSGGAAGAREVRRRASRSTTSLLASADFHARFPGRALADRSGEVPKQAGNNHPTSIPTGVFKTADGHINIASTGQQIWARFCNAAGAPELMRTTGISDRRRALEESRRAQCRDRTLHGQAHQRGLDRAAQQGGRAVRADLHDRPDVRRPAGGASRHGAAGARSRTSRKMRSSASR